MGESATKQLQDETKGTDDRRLDGRHDHTVGERGLQVDGQQVDLTPNMVRTKQNYWQHEILVEQLRVYRCHIGGQSRVIAALPFGRSEGLSTCRRQSRFRETAPRVHTLRSEPASVRIILTTQLIERRIVPPNNFWRLTLSLSLIISLRDGYKCLSFPQVTTMWPLCGTVRSSLIRWTSSPPFQKSPPYHPRHHLRRCRCFCATCPPTACRCLWCVATETIQW